jgi:hypothetical protein
MNIDESATVPPQFQFLLDDLGFRVVASEVSPYFDNMSIVLKNDSLNVRIVRDRGFLDAEISPHFASGTWKPLALLRQVVLRLHGAEIVSIDAQADFLRTHYDTVVAMLSPETWDRTVELIREFGRARFLNMLPGQIEK